MARTRNIKPGFFKNDELAECSPLARLLFAGLWTIADRDGRGDYRPKMIKVETLPHDDCNIDTLAAELVEREFIVIYQVDGKLYFEIPTFGSHQNPHKDEKSRNLPASTVQVRCKYECGLWKTGSDRAFFLPPSSNHLPPSTSNLPPTTLHPADAGPVVSEAKPERKPDQSDEVRQVFDHYRTHHPKAHKSPQRSSREWKAIAARLAEGSTVAELCEAIDGCHKTPHNLGQNDRQQTYLGLELIMRNGDQVARFMEANARAGPILGRGSQQASAAIESLMAKEFGTKSKPLFENEHAKH